MPINKNLEVKKPKVTKKVAKVTKKTPTKKPKVVKIVEEEAVQAVPMVADQNIFIPSTTEQTNTLIRDLKYWKILAWFGVSTIVVLLVVSIIALLSGPDNSNKNNFVVVGNRPAKKIAEVAVKQMPAPLSGLPMTTDLLSRRAWAVVVENFPTVRPQFGLSQADIIFESPTEGGITRFLAIFQSQMPDKVGPIRSARSYFNDWARPYAPYFSHSGGSSKALRQLSEGYGNIFDVNEFYHGSAYTRDNSLNAPHNLFTSADKFLSYIKERDKLGGPNIQAMTFVDQPAGSATVSQITVPYKPEEYEVDFKYNADGYYERELMGQTQTDANTKSALRISNVVVLFTDVTPITNDPLKRVDLRTLGQGKILVFTNGQKYTGTWQKNNLDSDIKFLDDNGQPIPLKPGQTWISVIDKSYLKSVVIK